MHDKIERKKKTVSTCFASRQIAETNSEERLEGFAYEEPEGQREAL
jgi:hypothetical protein